jgi:hypothetical protein
MEAVVNPCRRFHDCEGCSHCSENPRLCEYCADPWDECLCDFQNLPEDEDKDGGELFTACAECGAWGIRVDDEGMAAELCEACEVDDLPAVKVISALSELSVDLVAMYTPDISERAKADYVRTLAEAVHLLRSHAIPEGHPWAVK